MHRICGECTKERNLSRTRCLAHDQNLYELKYHFYMTVQKHKGNNAMVCLDKLACFTLEQIHKRLLIIYSEQEFSFTTFAAHFKFPNLLLLFLLILKRFQKAFKTFLGCFMVWYEMFTTTLQYFNFSWPIKAWHFLFLWWNFAGKCGQSAGHPAATLYSANVHNVL